MFSMSRKARQVGTQPSPSQSTRLSLRFGIDHHVCDAEICVGKVEWSRGVDPGHVQRPDDIVKFEHPFYWPSIHLTLNFGSSALVSVSKCLNECGFSSEWPTQ